MKFVKKNPETLDFNDVVMKLIKESRENGVETKAGFQYLICHGNVKYLVNLEVDGIQKHMEELGSCEYKTVVGG